MAIDSDGVICNSTNAPCRSTVKPVRIPIRSCVSRRCSASMLPIGSPANATTMSPTRRPARAAAREDGHGVFIEYAWDMGWCDPCAAEPLSQAELAALGAQWGGANDAVVNRFPGGLSTGNAPFVTRLHVRYDAKSFPEDLAFIETSDRDNFQGRYILRYPSTSTAACEANKAYRASLPDRFNKEADNLAHLTGWAKDDIVKRMAAAGQNIARP